MFTFLKNQHCTKDDILVMFGSGTSLIALTIFSIFRFLTGDIHLATLDLVISLILMMIFIQSWRGRTSEHLNMLLVVGYMGTLFAALYLKGPELLYWAYPCLAATYFLLPVRIALPMNIICLFATIPILFPMLAITDFISVYATLSLLCIFGYIFSARTEHQKKELSKLAREDGLTGVGNRRAMEDRMDELVATYQRTQQPASLLILDLDFFKKINDTYGHPVGDKILVRLTQLIKAKIRVTDLMYRFGGEEFVVIANNTPLMNAAKLAEYLREIVQQDKSFRKYHVTCSIGVSEIGDFDDKESWLKRADTALYEAKSNGRNVVYVARPTRKIGTFRFEAFAEQANESIKREEKSVIKLKSFNKSSLSSAS